MKCSRVQDAISPYLDGRLTGAEMMEIREHIEKCSECAAELAAIQRVKVYLASLSRPMSDEALAERIREQLGDTQSTSLPFAGLSLPHALVSGPPHARRLATTLALSCVGLLAFAMPFAPANVQVAVRVPASRAPQLPVFDTPLTASVDPHTFFGVRPQPHWSTWPGPPSMRRPYDDVRGFSFGPQRQTFMTSMAAYSR